MRFRVWVISLFCLIGTLLFVSSGFVQEKKIIKYGGMGYVDSLHPLSPTMAEIRIADLIFDGLKKAERTNNPDISDDRLTWTFYLDDQITWHDGRPVTAEDIRFTVDFIKQEYPSLLRLIDRVEQDSRYTVRIILNQAVAEEKDLPTLKILPAHNSLTRQNLAEFGGAPIGSGPFEYRGGSGRDLIRLIANERYIPTLNIQEIHRRTFLDARSMRNRLLQGAINMIPNLPAQHVDQVDDSNDHSVISRDSQAVACIVYNMRNKFLKNVKFRRTLTMAINKEGLVEDASSLTGAVVMHGPYPPSVAITKDDDDVKHYEHTDGFQGVPEYNDDLEKLKGLIRKIEFEVKGKKVKGKKVKYHDEKLSFLLAQSGALQTAQVRSIARYIRDSWDDIGVKVEFEVIDRNTFEDRVLNKRNFDIAFVTWDFEGHPNLRPLFHSRGGDNIMGYNNTRVDELLDEEPEDAPQAKQNELELYAIIAGDAPCAFLYTPKIHIGHHYSLFIGAVDPFSTFKHVETFDIRP